MRKVVKLAVSVPSHTPLMREAANRLVEAMSAYDLARRRRFRSCRTSMRTVHNGVAAIRDALARQLYLPVRWTAVRRRRSRRRGATRIAECGPGKVLTGLVKRIDKSIDASRARHAGRVGDVAALQRSRAHTLRVRRRRSAARLPTRV